MAMERSVDSASDSEVASSPGPVVVDVLHAHSSAGQKGAGAGGIGGATSRSGVGELASSTSTLGAGQFTPFLAPLVTFELLATRMVSYVSRAFWKRYLYVCMTAASISVRLVAFVEGSKMMSSATVVVRHNSLLDSDRSRRSLMAS